MGRPFKKKIKHVVDTSSIGANFSLGTNSALLIEGIDNPDTDVPTDVGSGRRVSNGILQIEINTSTTINPGVQVVDWYLIFSPQDSLVLPPPTTVGQQTTKPYVFKQGMEMFAAGSSSVLRKGIVKIPTKYSRLARGDRIYVVWKTRINNGTTDNFCFKCIFKEDLN